METIWKYTLPPTRPEGGILEFDMPRGARFLIMDKDAHGFPCMWWRVNPDIEQVKRKFYVTKTNTPVPDDPRARYRGFWIDYSEDKYHKHQSIWHLWEG